MRKLATIAAAAILAAILSGATTYAVRAATPVNWHQRTCSAFTAWDQHRTGARLDVLVVDSTRLGKSYLRADVGQLYADASSPSPKAAKYLGDDATYVNQDCGG
jgi:hypothetical protein